MDELQPAFLLERGRDWSATWLAQSFTCISGRSVSVVLAEEPPGLARCEVLSSSGLLGHEAIASSDATPVVEMVIR